MLLSLIQRLCALVSLAVLAVGGYLLWTGWRLHEMAQTYGYDDVDPQNWRLWLGGGLLAISLLGKLPLGLLLGRPGGDGERLHKHPAQTIETADGAMLSMHVEGPQDAPAIILVHGWGLEAGMFWDARQRLSQRYQVISYDLAGLGRSKQPRDGKYSLERLADHLQAVIAQAGRRKVLLVGHSIGGMTLLTFAERYPDMLGREVAGLVLENTTPANPMGTTILGDALHTLTPVLRPLMKLDIVLQPLVWVMNWQSYLSGWTHVAMRIGGFSYGPTRAQLNQAALDATRNSPAVQAKGNIAMMDWQGAHSLPRITVPALVFVGGDDIVTAPSAGRQIAWEIPGAQLHPVQDAGHLGPMELADEYDAAIEAFADRVFTLGARWADAPHLRPVPSAGDSPRSDGPARDGPWERPHS